MYSFSKYLQSVYCVPVIVLAKGMIALSKKWKFEVHEWVALKLQSSMEIKGVDQVWERWWFWLGTYWAWEAVGHPRAGIWRAAGSVVERKLALRIVGMYGGTWNICSRVGQQGNVSRSRAPSRRESRTAWFLAPCIWQMFLIHLFDHQLYFFL